MKIDYYKGARSNFGDDLNPWLWPKIIPDFFDDDGSTVFLGIGSIIGEKEYPSTVKKVVFGAGFVPEYHLKHPDVRTPDWQVYFVRGPRSAKMLGLPASLGIGDSATLLRTIMKPQASSSGAVSFMPHWQSMERGQWAEACRLARINLIDPRAPVETIISALQGSRLVIAEAMHGVIVADALRIPWVSAMPLNHVHRAKWLDWADSLQVDLRPQRLWPSCLIEARLSFLRKPVMALPVTDAMEKALLHAAAHRLEKLAAAPASLSADSAIDRTTTQMLEKVEQLRKDFA
jgi:succinoglycan biosynthesis protein ExoV